LLAERNAQDADTDESSLDPESVVALKKKLLGVMSDRSRLQSELEKLQADFGLARQANLASAAKDQAKEDGLGSATDVKRKALAYDELHSAYESLKRKHDAAQKEIAQLKEELAGIDPQFFEEIEDLKYNYQQAVLLNEEYEKKLKEFERYWKK